MRDPFSRLSTWYFSKKSLPYWGIILLDCCLILFSGLLASIGHAVGMPDSLSGRLSPVPYLFGDYTLFLFRGLAKGGVRRLVWLDLCGRVSGTDRFLSLFDVYP